MKIAHISSTFPPYEAGTGRVCYFNALELGRMGHEVTVFTSGHADDDVNYPEEFCVSHLATPFRIGNAPFLPQLLTVLQDFDIVHLHYPFIFGAELVWLACKRSGVPYVLTHHNDLLTEGLNIRQALFKLYSPVTTNLAAKNASRWIAVSMDHMMHCHLTPVLEGRLADVVEVPNGVDLSVFGKTGNSSDIRKQYGIPEDAFLVIFVGALDRAHLFKGVGRLIKAFAQVESENAYLMIIGDGNMKDKYQMMAKGLNIQTRCVFTGLVSHEKLAAYYSCADILVLPSLPPESFGMVLIEAMACGTPVIASNLPGVRTVVRDGINGLLVEPGNIQDLVDKMTTLLDSKELREKMGGQGRKIVEAEYTWPVVARKLETVYQAVLQEVS